MNRDKASPDRAPQPQGQKYELLERVTAVVLALVAVSLAWLLLAGSQIAWVRLPTLEWEVALVLVLFATALVLVSVLALLKSRE